MSPAAAGVNGAGGPVPFFINGQDYHPSSTFDVISPATGKLVHRCGSATVAEADLAVSAAAEALEEWRQTTPGHRKGIFVKAAQLLEERIDEMAQIGAEETGAALSWGVFIGHIGVDILTDLAGRMASVEGTIPTLQDSSMTGMVLREPYGVVLSVAPWNAILTLGMRAIAAPVAAGNTVVLKGTERSPRSMYALVSMFHEAGIPKGVINFITAEPSAAADVTTALIANPHVKKINFTGSTAVGRIVAKTAGEHLKPIVLELGGKAPAIVWEDADLDIAATSCAMGSFMNSGQVCMATEKILVHRAIAGKFKEKFTAAIKEMHPAEGDALILISSEATEKNRKLVQDATAKGAPIVLGSIEEISDTRMRPIVLEKVTKEMDIYSTESFGPTVSLIEVDTEEEAVRIANDTDYGLSAAVFTEDLRTGLRFARKIESGAVHINGMTIHDESAMPHGGVKASGYGRFNAGRGMDEWVKTKTVTFKN